MPRRKQVYKITYPNGKIYVGWKTSLALAQQWWGENGFGP